MTMMITFKVDADPVGKQRARYAKRGNFVQTYTPDKTRNYESLIKEAAIEAMGSSEPLKPL
jgi:Holliday junction resolvase RusA-like endonuclease